MDEALDAVRSGRRRASGARGGLVVAVTGAATGAGLAVAGRLARRSDVRRVVAIDEVRGDLAGVTWRVLDVADPALLERVRGCDVVVHAALDLGVTEDVARRSRRNVRGTQTVLTSAAAAGIRRVVVLSSAMVYGARPDNPVPLDEDAPLRAPADGALLADLLEIEALASRAPRAHPGLSVTVVRPAMLVGPGVDTVLTRHFEAPRLLVVRGSEPYWQLCHVEDAAAGLELAAVGAVKGAVTVGCQGWLSQQEVEELSGRGRLELPAVMAFGTAERLHRAGITPAPATELHYLTYPWVVPSTRLRAAGWRPAYDNATALEALLEQVGGQTAVGGRRVGRRETATLGAAGATVAVLSAAAVVRRARRRGRP